MVCRISIGFTECTLYSRNGARSVSDIEGRRVIEDASSNDLSSRDADDVRQLLNRVGGRYVSYDAAPSAVLSQLKDAVARGDIVVVSTSRQQSGGGGSSAQSVRPRYATVTPSQLVGRVRQAAARSYFERAAPSWAKLSADDGPAIFRANPGDVLPDGRIATALKCGSVSANPLAMRFGDVGTPLGDASPFEYESKIGDECFDLAGMSQMNGDPFSWIDSGPHEKKQWRMFGGDGSAGRHRLRLASRAT